MGMACGGSLNVVRRFSGESGAMQDSRGDWSGEGIERSGRGRVETAAEFVGQGGQRDGHWNSFVCRDSYPQ